MAKLKIIFNGTEYLIKDTKLKDAIAALHYQLGTLEGRPGLYQNGKLVQSWDSLVSSGAIVVNDGVVSTGTIMPEGVTLNEYGFYWDFWYKWYDDPVIMFHEDGSCDLTGIAAEVLGFTSAPAGTVKYEVGRIDANEVGFTTLIPSSDGTVLNHEYGYEFTVVLGTIPEVIGELVLSDNGDITVIGENAFAGQSKLTSVVIPDSVTSIGNYAFPRCDGMTSIELGEGVTSIGKSAFQDCTGLTSITIPDSVTSIGYYAFNGDGISDVYIRNAANWLNGSFGDAFNSNPTTHFLDNNGNEIVELVIPDGVTTIGSSAFYNSSLTSITIPDSVASIGTGSFVGLHSLTAITVSDGNLTYADEDGVLYNRDVTTLVYCPRGKSSVDIPDSVTSISGKAFSNTSCTSITIPDGVTSIGNNAFVNSSLTSFTFPSGVTNTGDGLFQSCKSLVSIIIPEGVTTIGSYLCMYCESLESVVIPATVKTIGTSAFQNCTGLTDIYYAGTEAMWKAITKKTAWDGMTNNNKTIHYNYTPS